ncbi:MAG: toll/interleukin-1 receptor domain-containing protein [Bacteroidales bacterium]|nr:toll/interleukin-1 receptor domain-containing protein [Bacteroidales bacterium]
MIQDFEYLAFISYKREDEKWAEWLQKKIEGYRLPARICKAHNLPPKLPRVFRDTTDIEPGPLSDTLQKSLDNSKFLIVVCSPRSARSYWVGEEINHFILSGRQDQILLFITDGIPYSADAETECLHPVIRENLPEMLGVNIHEEGSGWAYIKKEKAFIRLLSKSLDLTFDALWNRHRRKKINHALTSLLVFLLFLTGISFAWYINKPFNMAVGLEEAAPHSHQLSFPRSGAIMTLAFDNQQLKDTLYNSSDYAVFHNLPAKLRRSKARLSFKAIGYIALDTSLIPGETQVIPVSRDASYFGIIQGMVRNGPDDRLMADVEVEVLQIKTRTDANGRFRLVIPLTLQDTVYRASIRYHEKTINSNIIYPMQHNNLILNTIYLK